MFSIIKKTIFLERQGDRVRTAIPFYDFDAPPLIPRLNLKVAYHSVIRVQEVYTTNVQI